MSKHLKKNGSAGKKAVAAALTAILSVGAAVGIIFSEKEPADTEWDENEAVHYRVYAPKDIDRQEAINILEQYGEQRDIAYILENEEGLTDEALAAAANNPEKAGFIKGLLEESDREDEAEFTDDELEEGCPLLLQWDARWGYMPYGSGVIGMTGCAPTCMSMVILAMTDETDATPDKLARWAEEEGYSVEGAGTSWTYISAQAEEYGLAAQELPLWEASMTQTLDRGGLIVCCVGEGDFTQEGHYIVITGYDEDGFTVNDPNCIYRSGLKWTYSRLEGQISNLWAITAPVPL